MLHFRIVLPPPGASDVTARELAYQIGDGEQVIETLEASATELAGLSGNDNDQVVVSLTDIDDAGNRSEPREQTFTLTDTIAPPQPGEMGLIVDSES